MTTRKRQKRHGDDWGSPMTWGGVHLVGDLSTESSEELGPGWARGFTPAGSVEGIQPKKCGYLSISWTYIIWSLRVCDVPNSDWCQRLSTYLRFDPEATMAHQKSWSPLVDDIHLGKKTLSLALKDLGSIPTAESSNTMILHRSSRFACSLAHPSHPCPLDLEVGCAQFHTHQNNYK